MKRRLLNLLTLLSLLLCAAVCTLWVRSYFVQDMIYFPVGSRTAISQSAGGQLFTIVVNQAAGARWLRQANPVPDGGSRTRALMYIRWNFSPHRPSQHLIVPHWLVAAGGGLPALLRIGVRRYRKRRHHSGLCPSCGYDLRATPDRCPECGAENATISN
jgi:hypothetical protein